MISDKRRAIYEEAIGAAVTGDVLVQIGVEDGESLIYLARLAMKARKLVKVIGVDTRTLEHEQEERENSVINMVEKDHEAYANLTLLQMSESQALMRLDKQGIKPAMIYYTQHEAAARP